MAIKERRDLERKIEALIIAIPRETEANEFYLKLAGEYQDEASQEMFRFLAEQELRHRASLEHILAGLEEKLAKLPK
ncbi:MAG: rubrerythrin [Nitrospinae bacterium]|nr:rubrerythrin [Nitrospinota bacterium]